MSGYAAVSTIHETVLDAILTRFPVHLAAVNAELGTDAPPLAADPDGRGGKALYTREGVRYLFPCVEAIPPECTVSDDTDADWRVAVMTGQFITEGEVGVFLSYNGTEAQLTAWAVPYETALARTFLEPRVEGEEWWLPITMTSSPIVKVEDREGFFRTVLVTVRMQVAS